ncbi:MAG: hypothetical protein RIS64_3961 [Bacteroidota bacterium]|jgi:hypothetical protein
MNRWIIIALLVAVGALYFSQKRTPRNIYRSFYYWKQVPSTINETFDSTQLNALKLKRMYIKFFDIDWRLGDGAYPRESFARNLDSLTMPIEVVPVVYIMNHVFQKADSTSLNRLTQKLVEKIGVKYPEIQLDCDWSGSTRDKYFNWLRQLRAALPKTVLLSATIRLHQIKDKVKMGVPPVDRGLLMMYNFLNPSDFNERNSIFEAAEAKKYLKNNAQYPLPLDVALPLFRWGIVYRSHKYFHLFNNLNSKVADSLLFLTKKGRFYEVNADTVFRNTYLRYGDKIKIEAIQDADLMDCARLAAPLVKKTNDLHISYFHYENDLITTFKPETYEQVFQIFNN